MAHRTASHQSSAKRSPRIMRSVPAEEVIDTGASRVRTTGPDRKLPIALANNTREASIELLNQLLADTMTLRDLYKKHHWQAGGPMFYSLHLLFDKHFQE